MQELECEDGTEHMKADILQVVKGIQIYRKDIV